MSKIKILFKKYSLPILAGIFIGTTYIPFFPWALTFCLVPLWYFWLQNKNSLRTIFIGGWITQFILNLIGFHWVAHTAIEFGGFPPAAGYVVLFLFASIAHLYFAFAGVLWAWLQKRVSRPLSILLIPLIFAVCESFNPTIFFWHLGYPWLWINLPGVHLAEWIGFYGINLVTLAINALLLLFIISRRRVVLIYAVLLFAVVNASGFALKHRFKEGDEQLKVLVIQGNIGNAVKSAQDKNTNFHEDILDTFIRLTREGLHDHPDVQLVIWPETAFPSLLYEPHLRHFGLQKKLKHFIMDTEVPLLTGAYQEENNQRDVFNSLVLLNKQGDVVKSYHKTLLLAFGEYFPGSRIFPKLKEWFPMVSDFGRGSGPTTLILDDKVHIGAQICYESLFDDFSSSVFQQGAQMIVNVTNDSWFGNNFEPKQHLYMTLARALEFRIPLIRSTNTGISTAISASGHIHSKSPLHEEWKGVFTVNYSKEQRPTLYSYYAGGWPWILLLLSIGVLILGRYVQPRDP